MTKRLMSISLVLACLALSGACSKKAAETGTNPQATVMLKDGTSFAGTVTKSSTAEITLQAANGETRTYPMGQVDSVQYANAATAVNTPAAPTANSPALGSSAPASGTPAQVASVPPSNPTIPAPGASPAVPAPAVPGPAPVVAESPTGSAPTGSAPAARPEPVEVVRVVPAGTSLSVRNNETIDSKLAASGQTYSAVISRDVLDAKGRVVIPSGSPAVLVVRSASGQGKMQGQSELALDLDTVTIRGRRYRVETTNIVETGRQGVGKNKRTAGFMGGGTALGALLGAVAGGGRGAAIGALSGAAAGTATQTLTRGKGVRVPSETVMTFRLEAPIRIREVR